MKNQGIKLVEIDQEMQQSYLDYAMSVIVSRALPDARDGLKPVQRRILYAMYDMGIRPDSSYKKSARIVGEVLGKYHPHGDTAVYEAMARLAQNFSIRYPLVDGQGNFGSIDGDPPAAMRYTEARLDPFSMELLERIDQDTVDFSRNFDDSLAEPIVLPSSIPNLLINGASGIAVGMATNIPPHNLGELIDAIIYILQNWDIFDDIGTDDLMRFVQGPDFPTGGIIVLEDARNELTTAYATGRGKLMVRGRVHLEDIGRGRSRLIITEIPFQVNKSQLIERIATLVRDGVLEGISDLRDESDRQGMRIVIELTKTDDPEAVLRKLYKHTPLQTTFGIILLALVNGEPRILTLKQALKVYIDHQLEVIRRCALFELNKAEKRANILRGLMIALKNLDAVIDLIRKADSEKEARSDLMKKFKLDQEQAQAILDMPLKRLTHLEQDKILKELSALEERISELKALLGSPEKMRSHLIEDQLVQKTKYSDPRRTQIVLLGEGISSKEMLTASSLVEADDVLVGITAEGKIGRCAPEKINEKGFEIPKWIIKSNTQQTVYFATETGKSYGIYVETLPRVETFAAGIDAKLISDWDQRDAIRAIFSISSEDKKSEEASVITCTKKGLVKKTLASELPFASAQSFVLCKINPGDQLMTVLVSKNNEEDVMLVSEDGMAIRFDQKDLRPMGLIAAGVNGMKLKEGVNLAGAILAGEKDFCCFVTSDWGLGKIAVSEFPKQARYGQGVKALRLNLAEKVAGAIRFEGGKSVILLRYGKHKTRQVRPAMVKPIKRTKMLEYFIKLINQVVSDIEVISSVEDRKKTKPDEGEREEKRQKEPAGSDEKSEVPIQKKRKAQPKAVKPDSKGLSDETQRENDGSGQISFL